MMFGRRSQGSLIEDGSVDYDYDEIDEPLSVTSLGQINLENPEMIESPARPSNYGTYVAISLGVANLVAVFIYMDLIATVILLAIFIAAIGVIAVIRFANRRSSDEISNENHPLSREYHPFHPPRPTLEKLQAGYTYPIMKHWIEAFQLTPATWRYRNSKNDEEDKPRQNSSKRVSLVQVLFVIIAIGLWVIASTTLLVWDLFSSDSHVPHGAIICVSLFLAFLVTLKLLVFTRITSRYNYSLVNLAGLTTHSGYLQHETESIALENITTQRVDSANFGERIFNLHVGNIEADTASPTPSAGLINVTWARTIMSAIFRLLQHQVAAQAKNEKDTALATVELCAWFALSMKLANTQAEVVNEHFRRLGIRPGENVAEHYGWPDSKDSAKTQQLPRAE